MSPRDPDPASSRRPTFFGRVDWRALPADLGSLPGGRSTRLPGLELSIADETVSFAAGPGELAVCAGRPRFADRALAEVAEERGAAAACLAAGRDAGDRLPQSLSGPFSVVFLDAARRFLLIATDRFSTHPVCWFEGPGVVAFADRADAVATDTAIDPQSIFDYLYFHVIPTPGTLFKGVRRVPPAHTLIAEPRGTSLRRRWFPHFDASRAGSFESAKREFREIVERAVARECGSGSPGCYLSGGTDSSTVAGMITRVTGRPAKTFSIGFDAQGYDEMRYARIAARHFATEHHEHYVTPSDVAEGIPAIAAWYDQPFGNSSALPAYYCARLAKREGVDRLLAGDGGDELFGGNSRYARQKLFEAYGAIPEAVRTSLIEPLLLADRGMATLPVLKKAASYVRQATTPMPARMSAYNPLLRVGVEEILAPDLLDKVDVGLPPEHERAVYGESAAESLIDRMLQYDWKLTLADNDLPKVYGTARLAGVEVAFPLLDDELVDFSLGLPPDWKVKGTRLRYFFKEALRGFLPDEIIAKKKHGFGLPFGLWMAREPALRQLAEQSVNALALRGIVREAFVRELLERRMPEHPGYYGELVWSFVMLEQWLTAHRDAAALQFHARRVA
jgi:asparagine synthase (glutamine-hydrolysing)